MSRPRRRGRDVHGVLLLDKPQGASSNDVLQTRRDAAGAVDVFGAEISGQEAIRICSPGY